MVNVATLTANLKADTRNFERGIKDSRRDLDRLERTTKDTERSTRRLDRQIGNTGFTLKQGLAVGAGVAGVAIGKFVKDSVRDANNLQESMNAVEKVFGPVADEIHALGETSAQEFGMATDTFNEFAVRFSAFADNIANKSGRDVVEIVDEMSGRVADFASVHNLSLERAAEVAQSTLAGETEVFRRFGGDVSAAAVEAKALEEGIVEAGEAMSEQDKIMARYMLFMEQTSDTAGDFKDTQGDLANATRTFQAELTNARAEIGEAMLPALANLVSAARDALPALKALADGLAVVFQGLAIAAAGSDMERFAIQTGQAVDSAEGLALALVQLDPGRATSSVIEEAKESIRAFIDEADLTPEAIRKVANNMDFLTEEMGLSEEGARAAAEVLEEELSRALFETRDAALLAREEIITVGDASGSSAGEFDAIARSAGGAARELTDMDSEARVLFGSVKVLSGGQDDLEFSTRRVEGAMRSLHDELRAQTDPLFALERASRQAAEAQDAVTTAREEFGEGSAEHLQAIQDAAEANMDLKGAAIDVRDATDLSREAFIEQQVQMGLAREDAELLADQFEALDDFSFSPKRIRVIADMSARDRALFGSSNLTVSGRQHGGPFLAHQPIVVGERGPELVSFDRPGMVDSGMGSGSAGGDTIVIPVYIGDEKIDEIIVDANTRLERRGRR